MNDINDINLHKLIGFRFIRNCLSDVVEMIILEDRIAKILEKNNTNALLINVFDPAISPRNVGIIAIKHQ